jgi:hypothetical protein
MPIPMRISDCGLRVTKCKFQMLFIVYFPPGHWPGGTQIHFTLHTPASVARSMSIMVPLA